MSTEIVSRINLLQVGWAIRMESDVPKNKSKQTWEFLTDICLEAIHVHTSESFLPSG